MMSKSDNHQSKRNDNEKWDRQVKASSYSQQPFTGEGNFRTSHAPSENWTHDPQFTRLVLCLWAIGAKYHKSTIISCHSPIHATYLYHNHVFGKPLAPLCRRHMWMSPKELHNQPASQPATQTGLLEAREGGDGHRADPHSLIPLPLFRARLLNRAAEWTYERISMAVNLNLRLES